MSLTAAEREPFRLALGQLTGTSTDRPDPVTWIEETLGESLYEKQREIAMSVHENRRTVVRACFDSGKSFLASRLALWWIETHAPGEALVVTTATTYHQVRAILWQELGNAHDAHELIGKVNQTEWYIGRRLVGFGRRPRDWSPDALTGHHRPYVLVIVDESSGVPKVIFEALEGLITNADSRILAIGNPYGADSHFAHISRPGSIWKSFRIRAWDTPAWTGEPVSDKAARSLLSKVWVEELAVELGQGYQAHPLWQTKVEGEFEEESDDQLISLAWVRAAVDHEDPPASRRHPTISVDVARYGEDETVIGALWGNHFEILETLHKKPLDQTAGAVMRHVHDLQCRDVRVDDDGVGGGVTDMLRAEGAHVMALRGGLKPRRGGKFVNARSEWWWQLRERFMDGDLDIPDDDVLIAQLCSVKYALDKKGRIAVESKDDMRKRGVKSPDRGDALVYAFARQGGATRTVAPSGAAVPSKNVLAGV